MSPTSTSDRLDSWIPPTISWEWLDDIFAVTVPKDDPDVVKFVATGQLEVVAGKNRKLTIVQAALETFGGSLRHQLTEAMWKAATLRPTVGPIRSSLKVIAYCYGAFSLPDDHLCILVSRHHTGTHYRWLPGNVKDEARRLLQKHADDVAAFEKNLAAARKESEEFYATNEAMKGHHDWRLGQMEMAAPVLQATELIRSLPKAVAFAVRQTYMVDQIDRAAANAISASPWTSTRDGSYSGLLANSVALVSWTPHEGIPGYPEIRWAVQRSLPSALAKPRQTQCSRPEFDTGDVTVADSSLITPPSDDPEGIVEALDGLQLDEHDIHGRIENIRGEIRGSGFEALAWFQAYHIWTEETWGIYIDAKKLDDFAGSLLEDLRRSRVSVSDATAGFLALMLTYSHELFHAKVEAVSSWLELTDRQRRYLRYKKQAYDAVRGTPEWFEEALANWASWKWFEDSALKKILVAQSNKIEEIEQAVKSSLDFSPDGYRHWRLGEKPSTWRIFANQLATGKPSTTNNGLPLEGILVGSQSYEFLPSDVPLRFVGKGVIADRLRANPKTFSQPTVRELEKALKHFGYTCDSSGGKGSHEKWTKDGKQFPVPRRDPVSQGVFKTFLEQVGIDRKQYFSEVRPKL